MTIKLPTLWALGLVGLLFTASGAHAQSTATPVVPGLLTTSGCTPSTETPCFFPNDATHPIYVNGATGGTVVVTGNVSNASSAVATSATNIPNVSYNYGFNGTTWDQLQVDGSKNLKTVFSNTTIAVTNAGTFATQATVQPSTSGGLSIKRLLVANNTTSVAVDASPGQLYGIEAFNNSATVAYIKLYNTAQGSTTCGAGTVIYSGMIPANSTSGAGYISMNVYGLPFSTAITACVTTGYADNDATAPAASAYIVNFFYK